MKTIVFDFDGVIHSYKSGWQGPDVITDPVVPGIKEAIAKIRQAGYKVVVVSTRCATESGMAAIFAYLENNGIVVDDVVSEKPPAIAYIDDRAICFDGEADTLLGKIVNFEPWHKKNIANRNLVETFETRAAEMIKYARSKGLSNGASLGYHSGQMDEIADFIEATVKMLVDKEYEMIGVMHFVDKWLDEGEMNMDAVNRAAFMREKTLCLIETAEAKVEKLEKELKALRAFKSYFGELYGTGLEVANWHQNGSTEEFDNFFDAAEDEYIKVIEREGQSND